MERMGRILVLKTGSTLPAVRERHGDFDRWFVESIGPAVGRFDVIDLPSGARPPPASSVAGVVVTGSPSSLTVAEPWYDDALEWLRGAVESGVPVLGVCFGHQMLAVAFGGRVETNPLGREIGTVDVRLTEAGSVDPLFAGLPPVVRVQASHVDSVTALPPGAVLLATNEACPVQAFALGERTRAVQWHPEFSSDVIRGYIDGRAALLRAEGIDPDRLRAAAEETPSGPRILRNFERGMIRP